jgi:hypothetical protein
MLIWLFILILLFLLTASTKEGATFEESDPTCTSQLEKNANNILALQEQLQAVLDLQDRVKEIEQSNEGNSQQLSQLVDNSLKTA